MRAVVQIGLMLSAGIVLIALALPAYFAVVSGADDGLMTLVVTVFVCALALPVIWLGVFVVYVVLKAIRVSSEL
jgi:hypothetical protein